jgi:hypothetical protein
MGFRFSEKDQRKRSTYKTMNRIKIRQNEYILSLESSMCAMTMLTDNLGSSSSFLPLKLMARIFSFIEIENLARS